MLISDTVLIGLISRGTKAKILYNPFCAKADVSDADGCCCRSSWHSSHVVCAWVSTPMESWRSGTRVHGSPFPAHRLASPVQLLLGGTSMERLRLAACGSGVLSCKIPLRIHQYLETYQGKVRVTKLLQIRGLLCKERLFVFFRPSF